MLSIKEQIRAVYCNKELLSNHSSEVKEDLFIFLKDKIAEYEALVSKYKTVKSMSCLFIQIHKSINK